MRHAIIESGVVTNVVLADEQFAAEQGWAAAPDNVGPGWLYADGVFSAPPAPPPPPEPPKPTKEQLFAKLQELQQQIAALSN
jgi:hypothetical protein